ncbi:hypothetical protein OWV82_009655 [Melia azedarach]|nr:hypothetical protein OWV82_009655 [Melia azedarach]
MLFLLLVVSFFFLSIFFAVTLFLTYKKIKRLQELENYANVLKGSLENSARSNKTENDPTRMAESLLREILPSKSAKWETFVRSGKRREPEKAEPLQEKVAQKGWPTVQEEVGQKGGPPVQEEVEEKSEPVQEGEKAEPVQQEEKKVKKKKKKAKKKLVDSKVEENGVGTEKPESGLDIPQLGCLCPLTSMGSATQQKIKDLYHELLDSYHNDEMTHAQVGEFSKCLAKAKKELENKSKVVDRKISIKRALLGKADRSSIERLRQQIMELEGQQSRLEADVIVYDWLHYRLQHSPACKKMLEVTANKERSKKSSKPPKRTDKDEFGCISFEELLAQEKKDAFWQKDWKLRMCSR